MLAPILFPGETRRDRSSALRASHDESSESFLAHHLRSGMTTLDRGPIRGVPRSRGALGRAILIGLPILRSVGRKCQTAEIRFAQSECPDQPAALVGPHPADLKQQLRDSFGKGSAARKGAQRQRGIRLRTRAKTQAAAGTADISGGAKLGEKSAAGGETAYGEGKYGKGSGLTA